MQFRPFTDARIFVRSLGLKNKIEWYNYCAGKSTGIPPLPADVPPNPEMAYGREGWCGFDDFLGCAKNGPGSRSNACSFVQARLFARSLKLSSASEWFKYCAGKVAGKPAKPDNVPSTPYKVYEDKGWAGFGDFLGTTRQVPLKRRAARPYESARDFARSLGLKSSTEWKEKYRFGLMPDKPERPADIPSCPDITYSDSGWTGWEDFLGFKAVVRVWRTYEDARAFARSLKFNTIAAWLRYLKKEGAPGGSFPSDIPHTPEDVYSGEWNGWPDFLGFEKQQVHFRYEEARSFARSLNLKKFSDWQAYLNGKKPHLPPVPTQLSRTPSKTYRFHGWIGWDDFLGVTTGFKRRMECVPFDESRAFAHTLGLKTRTEWDLYLRGRYDHLPKKPKSMPSRPEEYYGPLEKGGWGGWKGWDDFLVPAISVVQQKSVAA